MLLIHFCFANVKICFWFFAFLLLSFFFYSELYVKVVNFLGKLVNGTCL